MGRNKVDIDNNHYIVFGFDAPCDGYFAEYYDKTSEIYIKTNGPSEEIGFMNGVGKSKILNFLEKYNAIEQARKQQVVAYTHMILDLPC